jgi:hypothetical protein
MFTKMMKLRQKFPHLASSLKFHSFHVLLQSSSDHKLLGLMKTLGEDRQYSKPWLLYPAIRQKHLIQMLCLKLQEIIMHYYPTPHYASCIHIMVRC